MSRVNTIEMPMVINTCYGGYSLSVEAELEIARRKWIELTHIERDYYAVKGTYETISSYVPRNDPDLIAVVREMGEKANGDYARLKVIELTINVSLSDFDGKEEAEVYASYN